MKSAAGPLAHKLLEAVNALADVLEIGQRPANPAACDIRGSHALGDIFDDARSLVFAADEDDLLAGRGDGRDERAGGVETAGCFLKVENVGAVLRGEEVRARSRMTAGAHIAEKSSCGTKGLDNGRSN